MTNRYIQDTFYIDTISIKTLTEDIFYRVVAADVRENVSDFSPFTRLRKPDIIPPGPSVFKKYTSNGDAINLEWAPSSTHDVKFQILFRKEDNSEWQTLDTLDRSEDKYSDEKLEPNKRYHYRILAMDDANQMSKSANDLSIFSPVQELKSNVILSSIQKADLTIYTLQYKGSKEDLDKIVIYKESNMSKSTFKVLRSDDLPFSFESNKGNYSARAFYMDGHKSKFLTAISE